ncbi:serine/threonine-protein kinase [Actinoplanes sp. TFC3]|uniref:serine/threonine-protein kinase n=1 Tax=Actinoplanes sp. TFC3 TaxID=1710355 RepID=UPI0008361D4B|nr:serine/threonine-protein kinase [Actinoplanes sp. TFC3]
MSIPARVGRYRVERRLGSGAFATVWLAEDDQLESWVAIKVLADNWAHQPDVRARFEQEAQVLRRAESERLVRILDVGELPDGRPYQVMTYAGGGTLAQRLAKGPMPVREALGTAVAIARATEDLHESGVLHRDLKPSNVLIATIRGSERVLVADLGLAKAIAYASGFTVVAGTPGYMAPEQSRPGGGLDVRADVYAVGALTYEMLTRQPPSATKPVEPSRLRPGVSRAVDRIVMRALAAERDRRWPSAAAFADALDAVLATPRQHRNRIGQAVGRLTGTVLALACLALTAGSVHTERWVWVSDASGAVSLAVPPAWAGQLKDAGWNPAAVGLPAAQQPGLSVAQDINLWGTEDSAGPGVFAGTAPREIEATDLPVHPRCARQPGRTVTVNGSTGRATRYTGCAGTSISYSEVAAGRLYVQIKQIGDEDLTDAILRTVHA